MESIIRLPRESCGVNKVKAVFFDRRDCILDLEMARLRRSGGLLAFGKLWIRPVDYYLECCVEAGF